MKRLVQTGLLVLATVAAVAAQPRYQEPGQPGYRLSTIDRFRGETRVRTEAGFQPVGVHVQQWSLGGATRIAQLPIQGRGLLIVQLRGGELTTIIGSRREERREGELWTVPAGVAMGVETEDDSAVFQTVLIADR